MAQMGADFAFFNRQMTQMAQTLGHLLPGGRRCAPWCDDGIVRSSAEPELCRCSEGGMQMTAQLKLGGYCARASAGSSILLMPPKEVGAGGIRRVGWSVALFDRISS